MLRDVVEQVAVVLRATVGVELATDGIDAEIEPRMVMSPSAPIVLDVFQGIGSARDSEAAAFGDISGFYVLTVRARATANDGDEWQDILLDMTDDNHALSIAYAVENTDQTLGGYATQVVVDPDGFSGLLEFGSGTAAPYVGCTWRVLVGVAVS